MGGGTSQSTNRVSGYGGNIEHTFHCSDGPEDVSKGIDEMDGKDRSSEGTHHVLQVDWSSIDDVRQISEELRIRIVHCFELWRVIERRSLRGDFL